MELVKSIFAFKVFLYLFTFNVLLYIYKDLKPLLNLIYFLINAIKPAMPNNTAPKTPNTEMLINNQIALIMRIIPPIFGF